jgi:Leucine-rich repeat (LRR) protein
MGVDAVFLAGYACYAVTVVLLVLPLLCCCRLATLHAAGNSLRELPQQLGPFTCLSCLDLSHNRLSGAALLPLGQLPALQQLLLSHNPVRHVPASGEQQQQREDDQLASVHLSCPSNGGFQQLTQLDLSHSKVSQAGQLLPLLQLPRLAELQLVGTPLAARCWSGAEPVKVSRAALDCLPGTECSTRLAIIIIIIMLPNQASTPSAPRPTRLAISTALLYE